MAEPLAKKVLLIGWDAADWKVIDPLLDAGKMPNLEKLVNEGVVGNLATLYPDLSPMLWTSIATGKRPFKHGVYGFTEPDPHTGGIRPITNISRKTKALWNILSQAGRKCIVVGWWPSHPAEPINGVMVSNHYTGVYVPLDRAWPMRPGTVHPERLLRNLAELRWHPQKLEAGHILPFVPEAAKVDQDKDRRLETLARIICDACTIQDAALALMHHEPWDFMAVYFDAIDHFCHAFMRFHPPRLDWVQEKDFEIYRHVVEGGYHLHDIILGKLLEKAGQSTTVVLVSDHGFHCGNLRPRHIPREPAGPAVQHRHYGIFAMKGPGIKHDERIYGASLLDVCPTILTLYGLPVGADVDGKTLVDAFEFEGRPAVNSIPSWDGISGEAGMHPMDRRIDPVEGREAIRQLVELGYIEKPDENREKAVAQSVRELDYNLARSYMDAGLHLEAIPLLEGLVESWPDDYRFGIQLVSCYQALKRISDARGVLEELFRRKEEAAAAARERLRKLNEEHKDSGAQDLSAEEQRELLSLRAKAAYNPYAVEYLMGSLLFAEGDEAGALAHLQRAEQADAGQPGLYLSLGAVYLKMKRWQDAERAFVRALDLDPDNAEAYRGLCESHLPRRQNAEAAEAALAAVGLIFHNPRGHFLLGVALGRLGQVSRALEALNVAVSQNPNFPEAHGRLAAIYKRLRISHKAAEHLRKAREAVGRIRALTEGRTEVFERPGEGRLDRAAAEVSPPGPVPEGVPLPAGPVDLSRTIVIVSGLPRSGTSMMMQMLQAGGLPVLTDEKRPADENNPRGYFEFEPTKRLRQDGSWLAGAKGRAVKIVAQLLPYLWPGFDYRVVFMLRDMEEIVSSQQKMLERQGKRRTELSEGGLGRVFAAQVARIGELLKARNVATLYVGYAEAIHQPSEVAARINSFLGGTLDEDAMAQAVEPDLYRQRTRREKETSYAPHPA